MRIRTILGAILGTCVLGLLPPTGARALGCTEGTGSGDRALEERHRQCSPGLELRGDRRHPDRNGLPVVYSKTAAVREDVAKLAPEAGYLLTVAFPSLPRDQANQILTETEGPGGGFLDDGSPFGAYSRLNLYAAAKRAEQITAGR